MSPRQIVQEVCTLLKSRAEQADISLKFILSPDVPDQVLGDPLLIEGVTFASGISINPRHVALIRHLLTTGPVGNIHVRIPDLSATA